MERVPDELEDARELLEFGLKKTNIKLTFNKLTADERQLVKYRTKLLKFSDSLTIYEVSRISYVLFLNLKLLHYSEPSFSYLFIPSENNWLPKEVQ